MEIDYKGKDNNWTSPLVLCLFFIFCQNFSPKKPINCSPTSQQLVKTDLYWIVGVYGGVWATKKIFTNKTNWLAAKFFLLLQPKSKSLLISEVRPRNEKRKHLCEPMKRKNNREVYDNNGKKRVKHWKHEGSTNIFEVA